MPSVGDPCTACCGNPCDFGVGCSLLNLSRLHATLTAISGNCNCLNAHVVELNYDQALQSFVGELVVCSDSGCKIRISLDCFGAGLEADCLSCNNNPGVVCASQTAQVDLGSASCTPLYLRYTIVWTNHVPNPCGDTTPTSAHFCCDKVVGQINDTGTFRVEVTL